MPNGQICLAQVRICFNNINTCIEIQLDSRFILQYICMCVIH